MDTMTVRTRVDRGGGATAGPERSFGRSLARRTIEAARDEAVLCRHHLVAEFALTLHGHLAAVLREAADELLCHIAAELPATWIGQKTMGDVATTRNVKGRQVVRSHPSFSAF